MKSIKRILVICIMLINVGFGRAQTKTTAKDIIIEARIVDPLIQTLPNGKTEINVRISKYPFSGLSMGLTAFDNYTKEVKFNEPFKIRIAAPKGRLYMLLGYDQGAHNYEIWSHADNIYMLEGGDSIQISLDKDDYRFKGKGVDKLNCENEIYHQMYLYKIPDDVFTLQAVQRDYEKYLKIINRSMDSCLAIQKIIVEKYRPKLGKEIADMLLANCYGLRYFNLLRGDRLDAYSGSSPGYYEAVVASPYYKSMDFSFIKTMPPELLVQVPLYVDFIFEKMRMDNFLEKDGVILLPQSIAKTYEMIKHDYSGIIRDKLLALFFLNYSTVPTSFNYLTEALDLMQSTLYREIIINIKESNSTGQPFYAFELPDAKGRMIKLQDFEKKVVILDFWYTGCENCINLKKAMTPIHDLYKDNPNVAFVSVSIDRDKQKWLKSIAKGLYTDALDTNLYTEGKAEDHPLLRTYSITAFPRTFILKDGKIFSSNPPYPNGKSVRDGGTKQYIDLMERAIAQNN